MNKVTVQLTYLFDQEPYASMNVAEIKDHVANLMAGGHMSQEAVIKVESACSGCKKDMDPSLLSGVHKCPDCTLSWIKS